MTEKKVIICDKCQKQLAVGKCAICENDLCEDCERYLVLSAYGFGIEWSESMGDIKNKNNYKWKEFIKNNNIKVNNLSPYNDKKIFKKFPKIIVCQSCLEGLKKATRVVEQELLDKLFQIFVDYAVVENL